MTMRLFVVLAVLIAAVLLNGALLAAETPPAAVKPKVTVATGDPLRKKVKWISSKRVKNLKNFGLTEQLQEDTLKLIKRLDKSESRSPKWKQVLEADQELASRCFCRFGKLPVRYKAAECLLEGDGDLRIPVKTASIRKALASQLWYDKLTVQGVYKSLELVEGRTDEATALGLSAMLLGVEQDAIEGLGDFGGGLFGSTDLKGLVAKRATLEDGLPAYFALLTVMAEAANAEGSICNRKIITDVGEDEDSEEMR